MAELLIIEDEPILAKNVCESLRLSGHAATSTATGEEGIAEAARLVPDLILVDFRLPGIDGLEVIRQLRAEGNSSSIIMMTAHGNIETAVEAMKRGASDFLTKPVDLHELRMVVERTLQHRVDAAELAYYRSRDRVESIDSQILGDCKPIRVVKEFVAKICAGSVLESEQPPSILIEGETGTGKDLLARAIHYSGPRKSKQFVQVNCTAMPDQLIESELFGHVKGSFTDARTDKRGLFEVADGGTIFLDEIGHMKGEFQAKLLNVLENRAIRPVGGMKEKRVNVHVIAATNRNLADAINEGEFREDLYHRLRVLTVLMPPLRDRGDDVELLAKHFLASCAARFGISLTGFSEDALAHIRQYDWPGNVRELLHCMESTVLTMDGAIVRPEHLNIRKAAQRGGLTLSLSDYKSIQIDFAQEQPKLEEVEYEIITAALDYASQNASRAARILGISRDAIRYRIDKYQKRS